MITIYHLERSRSDRIIWLCEELGLKYKLEKFKRTEQMQAPPEYKALHPLARAPLIADGDIKLIESGAIIDYIVSRYGKGKLKPEPKSPDFPRYVEFLHLAEGTVMAHFILAWAASQGGAPADARVASIGARLGEDFRYMDQALSRSPYFAGKALTGADIAMAYVIRTGRDSKMCDMSLYPNLASYMTRIEARPAYRKAMSLA